MVYLVEGEVEITEYMGDSVVKKFTNLVYADTEGGAKIKFVSFYETKTKEYSVYYNVKDVRVCETIK